MQSWNATTVFHLYLDELFETSQGIFLAKEARQAIATHLNRESLNLDKDAERAVNTAMKSVANIKEAVVARALFVSAHAGFEQYIRDLVAGAANSITTGGLVLEKLEAADKATVELLKGFQIKYAGEGFRNYFEPLHHISIDYPKVANAIVQSSRGDQPLMLEGQVFGLGIGNINQEIIERVFKRFGCVIPWAKLAEQKDFQQVLKTTTKKETEKELTIFLDKALVTRNKLAHTQGSVPLTKEELNQQLQFLRRVSTFLHETLSGSISTLVQKKPKQR